MIREKVIGQFCRFRKEYVPVQIRYLPGSHGDRMEKVCGKSECPNGKCSLSNAFSGNRAEGHDFLGEGGN